MKPVGQPTLMLILLLRRLFSTHTIMHVKWITIDWGTHLKAHSWWYLDVVLCSYCYILYQPPQRAISIRVCNLLVYSAPLTTWYQLVLFCMWSHTQYSYSSYVLLGTNVGPESPPAIIHTLLILVLKALDCYHAHRQSSCTGCLPHNGAREQMPLVWRE